MRHLVINAVSTLTPTKAICFFVRFWKLTVKMHFRLSHLSQKVETAAGTVGSRVVIAPAGPTFPGSSRA